MDDHSYLTCYNGMPVLWFATYGVNYHEQTVSFHSKLQECEKPGTISCFYLTVVLLYALSPFPSGEMPAMLIQFVSHFPVAIGVPLGACILANRW